MKKRELRENKFLGYFTKRFKIYLEAAKLVGLKNTLLAIKKIIVQKLGDYPKGIAVELSAFCNLNCAFCIVKKIKVWEYRQKKLLSFEEFKKLVDNVQHFCHRIDFAGAGEPLLNPEAYKILKYSSDRGILTSLFTNATFLTDENVDKLLDSGVHRVFTAFESFDPKIYETTKVGAHYDVTERNITRLIAEKKRRGLKLPHIILRMVVTKKNYKDIDAYIKAAREVGADAAAVKPLGIWPQGSPEYKRTMLEEFVVDHPMSRHKKDENGNFVPMEKEKTCTSIDMPKIFSDGSICLCAYDALGESVVGNINEDSFVNIWKKSKQFRKEKMSKGNALSICDECLGRGAAGIIINFR